MSTSRTMAKTIPSACPSRAQFTWNASATQTFGTCNRGQTFSAPNTPPRVTSTTPANGATGVAGASDLSASFSEPVTATAGAFALQCGVSGVVPLTHASSGATFALSKSTVLRAGESCTLTINAARITDAGGAHDVVKLPEAGRVTIGDPLAFAAAIGALLADPPSPQATRATVASFTWEANTAALYEHLTTLVTEHRT